MDVVPVLFDAEDVLEYEAAEDMSTMSDLLFRRSVIKALGVLH